MKVRRFADAAALAALFSVAACAPRAAGPSPVVVVGEPLDPMLAELRGRYDTGAEGQVRDSVAAPPERVHAAVVAAFRDLDIPADIVNPATGQVANTQFRAARELAGARLGRLLQCGETLTGPRADNDRVLLSVISKVTAAGAGSSFVETRVVAGATDVGGTGGRFACRSTGELERRLHDAVRRAAGAGA